MKKCPFLKLGAVPKSDLAGSKEMIIVVGNCMQEDCALWCAGGIGEEGVCVLRKLANE